MRFAFVVVLSLAAVCSAQQRDDPQHTGQFVNGRFWNASTEDERAYYLLAVRDSEYLADGKATWWAKGFTVGDYAKEIQKVYNDGENLNVPVIWVVRYCANKLRGEMTRAALERSLMDLRRIAVDMKMP